MLVFKVDDSNLNSNLNFTNVTNVLLMLQKLKQDLRLLYQYFKIVSKNAPATLR